MLVALSIIIGAPCRLSSASEGDAFDPTSLPGYPRGQTRQNRYPLHEAPMMISFAVLCVTVDFQNIEFKNKCNKNIAGNLKNCYTACMNTRKIIWINPQKVSKQTQVAAAKLWCGSDWDKAAVYENGQHNQGIGRFLSELRPGDPVGVYRADLLAYNPKIRKGQKLSDVFKDVARRLVGSGATVHELMPPGRVSTNAEDLVVMMLEARDRIAKNAVGHDRPGRPPKWDKLTSTELIQIKNAWENKNHRNNRDRLAAVHAAGFPTFTVADWYNMNREKRFAAMERS